MPRLPSPIYPYIIWNDHWLHYSTLNATHCLCLVNEEVDGYHSVVKSLYIKHLQHYTCLWAGQSSVLKPDTQIQHEHNWGNRCRAFWGDYETVLESEMQHYVCFQLEGMTHRMTSLLWSMSIYVKPFEQEQSQISYKVKYKLNCRFISCIGGFTWNLPFLIYLGYNTHEVEVMASWTCRVHVVLKTFWHSCERLHFQFSNSLSCLMSDIFTYLLMSADLTSLPCLFTSVNTSYNAPMTASSFQKLSCYISVNHSHQFKKKTPRIIVGLSWILENISKTTQQVQLSLTLYWDIWKRLKF